MGTKEGGTINSPISHKNAEVGLRAGKSLLGGMGPSWVGERIYTEMEHLCITHRSISVNFSRAGVGMWLLRGFLCEPESFKCILTRKRVGSRARNGGQVRFIDVVLKGLKALAGYHVTGSASVRAMGLRPVPVPVAPVTG